MPALEKRKPMDERELLAILREEETDASSYYTSELALAQAEASDRYFARPYGDEVEGRSQVVTHDIEDTINWMMPHLMRLFIQNDELVSVEDERDDDKQKADQIGEYLSHVFFKDNDGKQILYDFCFDGALQRIGVTRVAWEDPRPSPPKRIKGIFAEQLAKYVNDSEYEILGQDSEIQDIEGQQVEVFELEVRHTPKMGRVVVEQMPPEEYAVSRRAKSPKDADYQRRKTEEFVSDLIRQFPDSAHDLDPENFGLRSSDDQTDDLDTDPRRTSRFEEENYDIHSDQSKHYRRRKVDLLTEYIRVDYDGDGITELRQVKRVGNTILENIEVDKTEFIVWSPIRVAHRLVGRSFADTLCDIQKIRTVVTRKLLDSLAQSLAPRRVVNKTKLGEAGVDQLLDHDIGDVIEAEGDPREAVHELVTPDVSGSAYQALEYFDQRSEEASGVTRHAQGLKAEAITDTKGGIENLQAAANSRIELVGIWLGAGVEEIYQRIFDLIAAHQDQPRIVKLQGKPCQIDPRTWSDECTVSLHVGQAAETREAKIGKLMLIAKEQKEILLTLGMSNPLVTLRQYRETLALIARESGFRDPARFFQEIPEDWQPPEQGEQQDPKMVEVQGKLQLQQAEAQAKQQLSQAQAQHDAQLADTKRQTEEAIAAQKLENDRAIAEIRVESEERIAQMRIESESQIAYARMAAEQELARWKTEQELDLAKKNAAAKAEETNLNGGNRPGGKLHA